MPELRFPEFRDAPEWQKKQLDDLISTVAPPKKIVTTDYLVKGEFPIIDQGQSHIAGWTNDAESLIKDDLPLIVFGDHTCALKLVNQPFAQGADGIKVIKANHLATTEYLYQCLRFRPVVIEEYKRHFSILRIKTIVYPEKKSGEQQKIADCLSSIDDLITAQAKKIEALKAHKKGLMQQLFPAEGETVPRLRFPEFRGAPEWKKKKLGDISEVITGTTPSTADTQNYGGTRPFVSPADISSERYVAKTRTSLSEAGFELTRHVKPNSILFVCIGSTIGKVAQNKIQCATNQQINAVIPNDDYVSDFLYSTLEYQSVKIASLAGRQAVPIINKSQFSEVNLRVPDFCEQEKVARIFSSVDDLILSQSEKLETLKTHKKGLMQGLFPSTAEGEA